MNRPLEQLRLLMAERHMDAYLVPACDDHQSEYFSDYFAATRFLSHFTGEACTLVITAEEAMLWTDGRFFIQAEEQMDPAFTLCRMGTEGVPTVDEYLANTLPADGCLGFDGRLVTVRQMKTWQKELEGKNIRFAWEEDLVGAVWPDRPALTSKPAFLLDLCYAGKSASEKLADLRAEMKKAQADVHLLTSLDDIAWLFNIRGDDIPCNPVALSYAVITEETATLFLRKDVADKALEEALRAEGVTLGNYDAVYDCAAALPAGSRILVDESKVNMALTSRLPEGCQLVPAANPTTLMKSIKNETEIQNILSCHVKDGVAMVKFIYWLKTHIGRERITEISTSDVLEGFRREQPLNRGLSFETIAGYGPHGAMMHYMATPGTDAELAPEGFLLVDSGGQYLDGTTDITRTIVLGPLTDEQKRHFTAVVRGMLNLANARFLEGCSGLSLDYLARQPMWEMGIDYRCGTGHGVGFLLNVHEGPQSFFWKSRPGRENVALAPGMVTTDEPGIYLDYRYGIRTENELLCVRDEKNEYGQFLHFRHITFCPIDLDGIDKQYMTAEEVRLLNEYHALVYETLKDHLPEAEAAWLREATRAI
ncbi:MAG: aminopeptidase P family protein [Lachnospiraceae bacterium]|nr:aminopeptidase P family protein [Lachnospiraceae bacterium]